MTESKTWEDSKICSHENYVSCEMFAMFAPPLRFIDGGMHAIDLHAKKCEECSDDISALLLHRKPKGDIMQTLGGNHVKK